jgi:hypothetical protein
MSKLAPVLGRINKIGTGTTMNCPVVLALSEDSVPKEHV